MGGPAALAATGVGGGGIASAPLGAAAMVAPAAATDVGGSATAVSGGAVSPEVQARAHAQSMSIMARARESLGANFMVVNMAKMGLIGMIGGIAYAAAKGAAEHQGVLYELRFKTSAFDMDPMATQMFFKLGRYERLDTDSYALAIHYADKLFLIERHLSDRNSRPSDSDVPVAQACWNAVLSHIMQMRNKAPNGTIKGQINILKKQIDEMLADHMKRIYARCATLRP
jgi:hypothetical protein